MRYAPSRPHRSRKWRAAQTHDSASPYLTSHLKRVFDLVLATVMIGILLPMLMLAAISVKLSSSGAIIFRQKRHGLRQVPFVIFKFRSMHAECASDPTVRQATACDPRVTAIGRFLRKTSIDELPQLFNVLRGEMSLVGPRPHALVHDEKYIAELPTYASRFSAIPGITGLAQINGARGETPTLAHMQKRLQLDLEYIKRASIFLDLKILVYTVVAVIKHRADVY
ncbi:sugar transferase [Microvirga puerhi]|uniref:sugar transferase n=1 Tax=Microvirga puerhi TaxID=2876078 RepID=UPI003F6F4339